MRGKVSRPFLRQPQGGLCAAAATTAASPPEVKQLICGTGYRFALLSVSHRPQNAASAASSMSEMNVCPGECVIAKRGREAISTV